MEPVKQTNPWASPPPHGSTGKVSDADFWLHSTASIIGGTGQQSTMNEVGGFGHQSVGQSIVANGSVQQFDPFATSFAVQPNQHPHFSISQRAPHMMQMRTHSVDSAYSMSSQNGLQNSQTTHTAAVQNFSPKYFTAWNTGASTNVAATASPPVDPFDAAWASKTTSAQSRNPFQSSSDQKSFELKL